jgi:hypothetical protein
LGYRPLFLSQTCFIEVDLQLSQSVFEANVAASAKLFGKCLLVLAVD